MFQNIFGNRIHSFNLKNLILLFFGGGEFENYKLVTQKALKDYDYNFQPNRQQCQFRYEIF